MLYLGDLIDAHEALRLGMINRVIPHADLHKETMKFARRMALISPEALYAAKIAISRGAEAAGFRNAMQAGLDMMAPLYAAHTEVQKEFVEITRKDGLRIISETASGATACEKRSNSIPPLIKSFIK